MKSIQIIILSILWAAWEIFQLFYLFTITILTAPLLLLILYAGDFVSWMKRSVNS